MRDVYVAAEEHLEDHAEEHLHGTGGLDSLIDVMFGIEHVVAEFFWNAVFALGVYAFSRAMTLRKVHKYIDDKHGIKHENGDY
jgi:hypothetical protein